MKSRLKEVMGNPQAIYADPKAVLNDDELTREEKVEVLRNWKAEAVHIQESTAEGFGGGERSHLEEVVEALNAIER